MIILYVLEHCPYCNRALELLASNKIKYSSIIVKNTEEDKNFYKKQNKMTSFPQIFMKLDGDNYMKVGGCDDLQEIFEYCSSIKSANVSIDSIYGMYKLLYKK